eukprot:gene3416-8289_t
MESVQTLDHSKTVKRIFNNVPHPATQVLDLEEILAEDGLPNDQIICEHLRQEGRITARACIHILNTVKDILKSEPNVLRIPAPVVIVGDIHGQYYDLMKVFHVGGDPHSTQYLFLGDFVDRGYFSLECVLYIWALKIRFPKSIWLLRGNHECRHLTEYFTYKTEVEFKCNPEVYNACMESFDALPLAAIMNEQFFCVHGGISPELLLIEDIDKIDRFQEPDESGPMCDLLWSDPHENFDGDTGLSNFMHNETRGCSYVYTHKAVCEFLNRNKLLSVIRAHEAQDVGYRMYKSNPETGFPSVITIFSAPNYLDVYNNKHCFQHRLPNFLDVFSWSLPFIGEKTTEMLESIMSVCSTEELDNHDSEVDDLMDKMRAAIDNVKEKRRSYSDLADINRRALRLAGAMNPTGDNAEAEEMGEVHTFDEVRKIDKKNESWPTNKDVGKARRFRRRQTLDNIES